MAFFISTILGAVVSFMYMNFVKKQTKRDESLALKEALVVGITLILNPIIVDVIYYYGWKKDLPKKAKQANYIALLAFLIFIGYIMYINR